MNDSQKLLTASEQPFEFKGAVGTLEGIMTDAEDSRFMAIIGHPHSLQGGTINNKVVTTLVRTFKELKLPSVRFNFRGVGNSQGSFDNGKGESEDMVALYQQLKTDFPNRRFIYAGFSFGSYVCYRAAALTQAELLISIAPPFHRYNYQEYVLTCPWVVYQGEQDDLIPLEISQSFAKRFTPALKVRYFADTSHFFHGKLLDLKQQLLLDIPRLLEL